MKINISSIHFKADQKLEGFIQEKLNKLSTIYEGVLGSEVTLKIDKDEKMENKIDDRPIAVAGEGRKFSFSFCSTHAHCVCKHAICERCSFFNQCEIAFLPPSPSLPLSLSLLSISHLIKLTKCQLRSVANSRRQSVVSRSHSLPLNLYFLKRE